MGVWQAVGAVVAVKGVTVTLEPLASAAAMSPRQPDAALIEINAPRPARS